MKLTQNFTLEELTFSPTAARMGIKNEPDAAQIENLTQLAIHILQPLRDYFNRPVSVSSGFRSALLNRAVGGAPNSQHLHGCAADIRIIGFTNDILWQYIHDFLQFDQLILEHVPAHNPNLGWVHVSYVPNGRRSAISIIAPGVERQGLAYAQ